MSEKYENINCYHYFLHFQRKIKFTGLALFISKKSNLDQIFGCATANASTIFSYYFDKTLLIKICSICFSDTNRFSDSRFAIIITELTHTQNTQSGVFHFFPMTIYLFVCGSCTGTPFLLLFCVNVNLSISH